MGSHIEGLGLSDAAVPLLRNLVHERTGVYFEETRFDVLAERLAPLVVERGFESFLDYYYLLRYDDSAASEWPRVMDALAVPETYFWREIDQIRAVVNIVVPSLVATNPVGPLRIWSVPCASGEEPLTIAMALEEAGWFERAAIEIHGSDASPMAIARARHGRYRERAFRSLPAALRERYFRKDGDAWEPDGRLASRITSWSVVNLMAPEPFGPFARAPVIFCRNVFIYFSEAGIRTVVDRFADAMPTPGYLCVGASESLLRITTCFDLEEIGGAFLYVKRRPQRGCFV
jgi:chemotaxis protein methyltransferase CheR